MTSISVITAVYNRAGVISEAMQSVAAQTHPRTEHIIQDGGSTDGTLQVIDRHRTAATHLLSSPDTGIYDAINKGIARATGDVIGLMHSDDFYSDDRVLERVAQAFREPDIDGVYGDLDYVSASAPDRIIRRWRSGSFDREKLRKGWMPPHPTLYLRREVFERHGVYDTSFRIAADYDAMLRYLAKGQIRLAYIPEVLVKMRVGGESNKSLRKVFLKSREDYRAIRRNDVGGLPTLAMKNVSKLKQFF